MIKSLFDDIEEDNQDKIVIVNQPEAQIEPESLPEDEFLPDIPDLNDEAAATEIPDLPDEQTSNRINAETSDEILPPSEISILQDAPAADEPTAQSAFSAANEAKTINELRMQSNTSNTRNTPIITETEIKNEPAFSPMQTKPQSLAETSRKSGLAMTAAITLFGSVVFLLIIGWFADLLLGTSPWGKVGGIVLGSIIGFFQFFRMTSQILKNKD